MQPTDARAVIERARNAWTTGEAQAFAALFTPDGEFIVPGKRWVGRDVIVRVFLDYGAHCAQVHVEIRQILVDGEHAAVEWTWHETARVTGRRTQAEDAILIDFQAGLISRWRQYIDNETPKAKA